MSIRSEVVRWRVKYRWVSYHPETTFKEYDAHELATSHAKALRAIPELDAVSVVQVTYRMLSESERESYPEWITLEGDDDGEQD
jgi:hypothetical protein